MDPRRDVFGSNSAVKNLETVLSLLKYHTDDEAWKVAKAFQLCVKDQEAAEAAGYYPGPLVQWLCTELLVGSLDEVLNLIRTYQGPAPDPLLDRLRVLIGNLNAANKRDGRQFEEDKGSEHIGVEGYDESQAGDVSVRIGMAAMALQEFLKVHDAHFTVLIDDRSLLGYLIAVLGDKDVNTCNNEVANKMFVALDKQFAQVPPAMKVGQRLLKIGFFSQQLDLAVPEELDEDEAFQQVDRIRQLVATFNAGTFDPADVKEFVAAEPLFATLITDSYLRGVGIKKTLKELAELIGAVAGAPGDTMLTGKAKSAAGRVRFL